MQTVHWQRQQQKPRQKQHLNKNVCNDPVQAEALAAGLLQVFHKKDCNCEVTEHYISKISEEELNDYVTGKRCFWWNRNWRDRFL